MSDEALHEEDSEYIKYKKMNDFTKTDLKEILRCLKYMTKGSVTPYSCHTKALVKKARSMVDNYDKPCEHNNKRRLRLLDGHEYDICANCDFIGQMR